jgi:hypothetical protein
MSRHLTDDELIDRLYGIGDGAPHCVECEARFQAMQRVRVEAGKAGEPAPDFLAAQRRAIYSRLGERAGEGVSRMAWAPATVGALCLFAAGVFVYHAAMPVPAPVRAPATHIAAAHVDSDDSQLFSDVYAMEQSSEPRAAEPIHALIEEN